MPEIPTKWNLSLLYKADTDPQIDIDIKQLEIDYLAFIEKWKERTDYTNSPDILFELLREFEVLDDMHYKPGYYYSLRDAQDSTNVFIKTKLNAIIDLSTRLQNQTLPILLKVSKIEPAKQPTFLQAEILKPYQHYLENTFEEGKHLLGEEAEQALNLMYKSAYDDWIDLTSNALSKAEKLVNTEDGKKKYTYTQILGLFKHNVPSITTSAAAALNSILNAHADMATAELNALLNYKKNRDALRKYPRPDTYRHILDDIPSAVVDTLIEAVSEKYSQAQDYYKLKAKLLNKDKLKYHERMIEYGKVTKNYDYESAISLVRKSFSSLDSEFETIFNSFITAGHFDVFPAKGKSGGAFCTAVNKNSPVYILLNHNNTFSDVTTIAHEMGHALNDVYMARYESGLNFSTSLCVAEVASTFMEDFVFEEALIGVSDEERLALLMGKLDSLVASIHRQAACYQFEQDLHKTYREKLYLSKDDIGKLFKKYMGAYMGPAVELSKGSENWWVYWSHIRNFFYVYSYVSGELISMYLQDQVRKDKNYIRNVKRFLSIGGSKAPVDIFKELGIDISDKSFWLSGLQRIDALLIEATQLAQKLGKI